MPIGTIIGFLIGTLVLGFTLVVQNSKIDHSQPIAAVLLKQIVWIIGGSLEIISIFALIGTFIEMALT